MSRVEEVGKNSIEIEIDKSRALIEEKRLVQEHFLEGHEFVFELPEHLFSLRAPFADATAAEFPFFVAQKTQLIRERNHFAPINVV